MSASCDKTVARLIRFVEEMRKLDPEMQLQTLLTYLYVAQDKSGGMAMATIADKLHISQSSTSRNVAYMGKMNRKKEPGLQVLTAREDPMDSRRKLVTMTSKGDRLKETICEIMEG